MYLNVGGWAIACGRRVAQLAERAREHLRARRVQGAVTSAAVLLSVMAIGMVWSHASSARHRNLVAARSSTTPMPATTRATSRLTDAPTSTETPAPSVTPTMTPSKTASPAPTSSSTQTATATAGRAPVQTPSALPSASPTVDPAYLAEDTLEGTGPGPAGPLSGLPTRPDWANRRPVAVVIDNFAPDARPLAGLNRASLVYETLVEGGVTRLLAVFLERDAPIVGPVRSARIYFNAWASGLHAVYAHAGGNSDALYQLLNMPNVVNIDDLDLLAAPGPLGPPFVRALYRAAPHNLYTNTAELRAYAAQAGAPISGSLPATLPHRVPSQLLHRPDSALIDVALSSYAYNVHWVYDRATNRYSRYVEGVAQVDAISRRMIAPANIVVLFTPVTPDHDAFTPEGVNVHATGSGSALYFENGRVEKGTWRKVSTNAQLQLMDARGTPELFDPGQTWIDVVGQGSAVAYGAR